MHAGGQHHPSRRREIPLPLASGVQVGTTVAVNDAIVWRPPNRSDTADRQHLADAVVIAGGRGADGTRS